jgi:hypothetical protein
LIYNEEDEEDEGEGDSDPDNPPAENNEDNPETIGTETDNSSLENEEINEEVRRAKIISWKALRYEKPDLKCVQRLKLEIKGKYFEKGAEVKIGNLKAFDVDRKSSKKIVAKFCIEKLLENQTNRKRNISVANPDTKKEIAKKKLNLDNLDYDLKNSNLFDNNSLESVKNIQRGLNRLGYLEKENIIGIYGPKTRQAVQNFQIDNNISPTGYAGPITIERLSEKLK